MREGETRGTETKGVQGARGKQGGKTADGHHTNDDM
jgi:hypothetical protein